MWDMIVSVPDHCLSFYFVITVNKDWLIQCQGRGQQLLIKCI